MKWNVEETIALAEMAWETAMSELAAFGYAAPWFSGWADIPCGYDDERGFETADEYEAFLDAEDDMFEDGIRFYMLEASM